MKKFLSVLLSIIFALCLLFTLLLSVVRFNFSFSSVSKIFSEMMKPVAVAPAVDDGLYHPGDVKISLAGYEEYGDFDFGSLDLSSIDFTDTDVNQIVNSYLALSGVDVEPEFIAEVLASPEVSDFVDKYVGEIVDYMTGASEELKINPDDVLTVVNKSLDMYEEHTGEVVDRTGIKESIESNIEEAQTQITASLDETKAENAEMLGNLKIADYLLSLQFYLICIGVCVLLALILFLINRRIFTWLKYIFMPCFIDGVIIFIAACTIHGILPGYLSAAITDANLPKGIYEGVWSLASHLLFVMKVCGVVSAILGIALFTLGFSLDKKIAAKE